MSVGNIVVCSYIISGSREGQKGGGERKQMTVRTTLSSHILIVVVSSHEYADAHVQLKGIMRARVYLLFYDYEIPFYAYAFYDYARDTPTNRFVSSRISRVDLNGCACDRGMSMDHRLMH